MVVGVLVIVGVLVGVLVCVGVKVAVCVGVLVMVGVLVTVAVAVLVAVLVIVGVKVAVAVAVLVGVLVTVGVKVSVAVGVLVEVGIVVAVCVGVGVGQMVPRFTDPLLVLVAPFDHLADIVKVIVPVIEPFTISVPEIVPLPGTVAPTTMFVTVRLTAVMVATRLSLFLADQETCLVPLLRHTEDPVIVW